MNGGPAFPRPAFDVNDYTSDGAEGMSLRDYFAAKAMQGIYANHDLNDLTAEHAATWAYAAADAMLAERNKQP